VRQAREADPGARSRWCEVGALIIEEGALGTLRGTMFVYIIAAYSGREAMSAHIVLDVCSSKWPESDIYIRGSGVHDYRVGGPRSIDCEGYTRVIDL
jgi:hypothetical protein